VLPWPRLKIQAKRAPGIDPRNLIERRDMKILVGYDGSNAGEAAVTLAADHASAFDAEVHIVTSLSKGTDRQQREIRAGEADLARMKALCEEKGVSCNTHLLIRGLSSGEDLVQFADENKVDEIVVGVKRRSKVGKLLMGSTAQYVILKARCPVVTVK
jgi:nucleotide-binding universal stress UspA family protein